MTAARYLNTEQHRMENQRSGKEDWRLWGPYLSERAWGTVREDYSPNGSAWEYFDHDQARSRAYRWSEDGLGGICDEQQRLCFALALWNGKDPILKERAFGLTGNQGNRGEDVKEYYFYLDATPSHSYLRYLYKYPQSEYPYARLVKENQHRSRFDPPFSLMDSSVFNENRYWDIELCYAKSNPEEIHIRVLATNCGPDAATIHVLPTLWFRNTWSWGKSMDEWGSAKDESRPLISLIPPSSDVLWSVRTQHETLGNYFFHGWQQADTLFTNNETNTGKLWGNSGTTAYVKDAFHRYLINGQKDAVNPELYGTKFTACHILNVAAGKTGILEMVLSKTAQSQTVTRHKATLTRRATEAAKFYSDLLPACTGEDANILRQALAGMIWSKQYFHYDVARWLDGDTLPPPGSRKRGRNRAWRHMKAQHVISMPDKWEYPWFAAWDLAFHCSALALVDVEFAKDQIELLLREDYLHPNGQIPAYEWAFGDVNPPVLAMAALKVFRAERVQLGKGDFNFLARVTHKMLMNYTWWLNRKDADGNNVFEGGFLGLDNISVYDRSQPLLPGYTLKQADSTGWMAMFALNMTVMSLELAAEMHDYEDVAIQCYEQFMAIANSIAGYNQTGLTLWDEKDKFFKDLLVGPDGQGQHIDVFSWVGLIPLFAVEVIDQRLLQKAPRFEDVLVRHYKGTFDGHKVTHCPVQSNVRNEHLLSLLGPHRLKSVLARVLNESEFLSSYGVRSVSRIHAERRDLGILPGIGQALIEYVPGESTSGMFGGNSNWRGPVWIPTNYVLVQAIEKFHRYYGDGFAVAVPCLNGRKLNLKQVANLLAERLVNLYRRGDDGKIAAFPADSPFQNEPRWRDLLQFYEYFHGETGQGLGAAHQTGWTGLLANLVMRKYRKDIPVFWQEHTPQTVQTVPTPQPLETQPA